MKIDNDIGKKISEARNKLGITQQNLADQLFVSFKTISNWETGKNIPDIDMIKKLEKILNIKLLDNTVKKRKIIIASFILIIVAVIIILFNIQKQETSFYYISLDSDTYSIHNSYIMKDKNKIYINFGPITNNERPFSPAYKISLYYLYNEREIEIAFKKNYENLIVIDEKENKNVNVSDNLDNLYLRMIYTDYDAKKKYDDVKLIVSDHLEEKETPTDLLNLLTNNNYIEEEKNIFEKKIGSDTYRYDFNTNLFYYEGLYNDTYYNAIKKNDKLFYTISKNDKVIEYFLNDTSNGNEYLSIIQSKMEESSKIYKQ